MGLLTKCVIHSIYRGKCPLQSFLLPFIPFLPSLVLKSLYPISRDKGITLNGTGSSLLLRGMVPNKTLGGRPQRVPLSWKTRSRMTEDLVSFNKLIAVFEIEKTALDTLYFFSFLCKNQYIQS